MHIGNVPHMLQNGITHISTNSNPEYISIGDISMINFRKEKIVTVDNGDFLSQNAYTIRIGDFIPFYFGLKMPMLFVTQKGGNFVTAPTPAEDIIYIVCSLQKIINSPAEFYFSDGHCANKFTSFYDKTKIERLPTIIDWRAINSTYWGGDDNLTLKRKKQAEFLVKNEVAKELIIAFVCYNEKAANRLINMGVEKGTIKITKSAYF